MLTRFIVIGAFILVGVIVYLIARAVLNRGSVPPPTDIVDRPSASSTGTPKYESPDERIARLEEELRRLGDEDDEPRPGHS